MKYESRIGFYREDCLWPDQGCVVVQQGRIHEDLVTRSIVYNLTQILTQILTMEQ